MPRTVTLPADVGACNSRKIMTVARYSSLPELLLMLAAGIVLLGLMRLGPR